MVPHMKRQKYPSRDTIVPRYGDVSTSTSPSFTMLRKDLASPSRNCTFKLDSLEQFLRYKVGLTISARASLRVCSILATMALIALMSLQLVERMVTISAIFYSDACRDCGWPMTLPNERLTTIGRGQAPNTVVSVLGIAFQVRYCTGERPR